MSNHVSGTQATDQQAAAGQRREGAAEVAEELDNAQAYPDQKEEDTAA